MNLNGNELVSYNAGNLQVGNNDYLIGGCGDYYYHWHDHYYPIYYPTYHLVTEKSKVEQGFKIVAKMLENKIITKELAIKEFIKLVNDIAEIL
jgi:hypothetical protein